MRRPPRTPFATVRVMSQPPSHKACSIASSVVVRASALDRAGEGTPSPNQATFFIYGFLLPP